MIMHFTTQSLFNTLRPTNTRALRLSGLFLLTSLMSACISTPTISPPQVSEEVCQLPDSRSLSSIVRVAAEEGDSSSGVVISRNRVLTVAHALPTDQAIFIEINGRFQQAIPISISTELDLALLEVDTENLPTIGIAATSLESNEHVWAVGFPLAKDKRTSLGVFQHSKGNGLLTSAHINSGTSGGGLLRCSKEKYELAGIVRAYVAYEISGGHINSGDSLSVPADQVRSFVARADFHL